MSKPRAKKPPHTSTTAAPNTLLPREQLLAQTERETEPLRRVRQRLDEYERFWEERARLRETFLKPMRAVNSPRSGGPGDDIVTWAGDFVTVVQASRGVDIDETVWVGLPEGFDAGPARLALRTFALAAVGTVEDVAKHLRMVWADPSTHRPMRETLHKLQLGLFEQFNDETRELTARDYHDLRGHLPTDCYPTEETPLSLTSNQRIVLRVIKAAGSRVSFDQSCQTAARERINFVSSTTFYRVVDDLRGMGLVDRLGERTGVEITQAGEEILSRKANSHGDRGT